MVLNLNKTVNESRYIEQRPKFGEIWMCNLDSGKGSVQGGYRPVFVVSNNKNNRFSRTVNIIPITKDTEKAPKPYLPVHVKLLDYKRYGLCMPSILKVEQIATVNIDALDKRIGAIPDADVLESINQAFNVQIPVVGYLRPVNRNDS